MTILPRSPRFWRWTRRLALGAAAIVAIAVWLGHEFPGWFIGRKSSVELMAISVRNLPIIYSGHAVAGPYGAGIPNFSYLDRRSGRGWYFWGSDVLDFRRIFANREQDIPHSQPRPDCRGA